MALKSADFEAFFQKMAIPRFILDITGKGGPRITHINDLALKYFGKTAEDVIGKPVRDFMEGASADHFEQSFEVAAKRRQSVTIQSVPGIPGNKISIYGFYITPLADEKGRITHLDVIGQIDTSDSSLIQRERDDAISLLTSVFDVSEIGIIVTDPAGKIIRVNESFIRTYGWNRDELLGTDIAGLVTPDERTAFKSIQAECLKTRSHHSGELKIMRKSGNVAHILSTTASLELSQKRRYQVITAMDITLRKRMEESLRMAKEDADAANRSKSTFLANMSHELRTPLNAILGFSEMMIKETFGPLGGGKYKEYADDIHESARHLLEIINEVLDMSKIEAGRIEIDEGHVDIAPLVASVMRMMASRAFTDNIQIVVDIPDGLPPLEGDERLLRQALINLTANAIKFSHKNGTVKIQAALLKDNSIQIKIIDQGVGIPKDKIQQAMEPFGQISERAENANYQGTGLGLPLAKAMIEMHEGILELESDLGQGTTVTITLPDYRTLPKRGNVSKLSAPQ